MSIPNISYATLRSLVTLLEKREAIQAELSRIEAQISAALGGSPVKTNPTQTAKSKPAKRGKRGAVKEAVLAELTAAGKNGASVKELSSKLGIKNQNLHVWFHTTGKKIKGLKKVGKGQWVLAA